MMNLYFTEDHAFISHLFLYVCVEISLVHNGYIFLNFGTTIK